MRQAALVAGVSSLLCLPAQKAVAQQAPAPAPEKVAVPEGGLTLGGHRFIVPASFPTSFVATYFGIRLGALVHTDPDVPTEAGQFSLSTLGGAQTLELGVKVTDWLGFFAKARLAVLVGSNVPGLIYSGATYEGTGEGGLIFRILRIDTSGTQVSFRVSGSYSSGLSTSVFPLLVQEAALTVRTVLQGQLRQLIRTPISGWDAQGNAVAAQALGPYFSLQGLAGGGVSGARIEPFDVAAGARGSSAMTDGEFNAAVAIEADASAAGVPVAGLFEYSLARQPAVLEFLPLNGSGFVHTLSLGAYYSGKPNLQLGLVGAVDLGLPRFSTSLGPSGSPHTELGQIVVLYIW